MRPLSISVVVPTCNRNDFLRRALATVRQQELPASEIIIVDDSGSCVQLEFDSFSDASIISTPRMMSGVSVARNLGAAHATGDLIAFLDDDDWWGESYLRRCVETMIETDASLVCTAFWNVDEQGRVSPGKTPPVRFEAHDVYGRNPGFTGSNFVISRDVFAAVSGFDERLYTSNDRDFLLRVLDAGVTCAGLQERLVYRHNHTRSRLTQVSRRKILSSIRFYRKIERRLPLDERKRTRAKIHLLLHRYYRARGSRGASIRHLGRALMLCPEHSARTIVLGQYV